MAGVTIKLNDRLVRKHLKRLDRRLGDLTPAFRDIGEHLLTTTRARFDSMTDPQGNLWRPLSQSYRARKSKNQNLILDLDGYLRGTLNYRIEDGGKTLAIGSPMIYAGTMQFGAKKGQFGKTKRGVPIPWGDIPARPFLGLSADDRKEVVAILGDHLGG